MIEYAIDDLVPIGRLSQVDDEGYIRCRTDAPLDEVTEVYLIFPDDRVFLVTICDRRLQDGRQYVRFEEPEVPEEVRRVRQVRVCLAPDLADETVEDELTGWRVTDGAGLSGEVTGAFFNGAHPVLVVTLDDGRAIMLPEAGDWLEHQDEETRTITVPRLRELAEL